MNNQLAQEKADELIFKFRKDAKHWDCYNDEPTEENHKKNCAIICVEEIIKTQTIPSMTNFYNEVLTILKSR